MSSVAWNRVRVVALDAVGTLMFPAPSVVDAYLDHGRRFGSALDREQVEHRFREGYRRFHSRDCNHRTSDAIEKERWRRTVGFVFDDVTDAAGLFASLWEFFGIPQNWRLYDDVTMFMDRLAGMDIRIVVASNFDRRLHAICENLLPELEVVTSSSAGYSKPDERFYSQLASAMSVPPADVLMIGDDRRNDYQAALIAGCQAVWLDRENHAPAEPFRVTSLRQIL